MATLVQSSDLRRTSDRSVRFAVIAILSSVLAGCGGGSGGQQRRHRTTDAHHHFSQCDMRFG